MRISLFGAPTLSKFTEGILKSGLESIGCAVAGGCASPSCAVIQIHGSPAARDADVEIINTLAETVRGLSSAIILLHRPDEIRDSLQHLRSALADLPPHVGIVMLGDLLIDDPFYSLPQLSRRVIPHGFFDITSEKLPERVVIGSHTTWGEMRSIERTLLLFKEITHRYSEGPFIGYLGGLPIAELTCEAVVAKMLELGVADLFHVEPFRLEDWRRQIAKTSRPTIFVRPGEAAQNFDVTFNVQLYHYNEGIRMGESSGSLHASSGIPIIFEMNGSERIENLLTVKVPYSNSLRADSADLCEAALVIRNLITSGEYKRYLEHNREMASQWSPARTARLYLEYLRELAGR